jgi:hypothetical protein
MIPLVFRTTKSGAVALAAAAIAAGCAGSGSTGQTEEQVFREADLQRFVAVQPATAGWKWPKSRESPAPFTRRDLEAYDPQFPQQATLADEHKESGFIRSETSTWRSPNKKASSFATLFSQPEGARSGVAASNEFAHRWFRDVEHADIHDVSAGTLGEEAWAVRGGSPGALEFVEFGWRRGNVVFEVYVSCTRCASDVEQAALEWAEAIDEEARAAGNA